MIRLAALALCAALTAACGSAGGPGAASPAPSAAAASPTPAATPTQAATATPAATAQAGALAAIAARGKVIIAVKREISPRGVNQDVAHFQKRNFEIGIAGAIAAKLLGDASKLEELVVPKPDRIPAVTSGRADLVISMIPIVGANQALLDFSQPYATGGVTFMAKAGAGLKTLKDLEGKRVLIPMQERDEIDGPLSSLQYDAYTNVTAQSCPMFVECAAMVESGSADALLSNSINIAVHMNAKPGVFAAGDELWSETYGVGVAKGNADLLETVNTVIANLKSTGELGALATKAGFPTPAR